MNDFREAMSYLRHRQKITTNKVLKDALATVLDAYDELNNAITWDTSCLNCASLLDQNAEQYFKLDRIKRVLDGDL